MQDYAYPPPVLDDLRWSLGTPAETESDAIVPGSNSAPIVLSTQKKTGNQKKISLPMIPFYVRNNEPDLQEFSIF